MSTHVIAWKNSTNGRAGTGTKIMTEEEAVALAKELNEEYPDIIHAAKPVDGPAPNLDPPIEEQPKPHFVVLTDESLFPFGVHKGIRMKNVPSAFLDYVDGQSWIGSWPAVKDYIDRNRAAINQDLERKERQ